MTRVWLSFLEIVRLPWTEDEKVTRGDEPLDSLCVILRRRNEHSTNWNTQQYSPMSSLEIE